jgi:hypothetical protein
MERSERFDLEALALWALLDSQALLCPVCGSILVGRRLFTHIGEASDSELQEIALPGMLEGKLNTQQARGLRGLWEMMDDFQTDAFGR